MFVWTFGQASLVTLLAFCYVFVVLDEARHLHNYSEWERGRGFPLPLIIEKQYNFAFVLNFFGGFSFTFIVVCTVARKDTGMSKLSSHAPKPLRINRLLI